MGAATTHKVKIFNHYADQVVEVEVPEDRCGDAHSQPLACDARHALLYFQPHMHQNIMNNMLFVYLKLFGRYVLWEAEDQGLELPYACRMGCCTACAVKVVEGELFQPQVR